VRSDRDADAWRELPYIGHRLHRAPPSSGKHGAHSRLNQFAAAVSLLRLVGVYSCRGGCAVARPGSRGQGIERA